jgi:hypothetical protein
MFGVMITAGLLQSPQTSLSNTWGMIRAGAEPRTLPGGPQRAPTHALRGSRPLKPNRKVWPNLRNQAAAAGFARSVPSRTRYTTTPFVTVTYLRLLRCLTRYHLRGTRCRTGDRTRSRRPSHVPPSGTGCPMRDPWAPTSRAASSTLTGARPASDRPRDHRCDVSTSTLHRGYGCAAAQLAAVLISRTCRHQAVALTATLSPTSLPLGPTGGSSTPPPVAFRILLFHNMIHGQSSLSMTHLAFIGDLKRRRFRSRK